MSRASEKCNLPKDGFAFKIIPSGLNKTLGNPESKSRWSLTVKSVKETDGTVRREPSDRNNYSLEGGKRAERHLCLFFENVENTVSPSCLHKIKPTPNCHGEVFANTPNQSPTDPMACFLSCPPLRFKDGNFICAPTPPVRSTSILIHL